MDIIIWEIEEELKNTDKRIEDLEVEIENWNRDDWEDMIDDLINLKGYRSGLLFALNCIVWASVRFELFRLNK